MGKRRYRFRKGGTLVMSPDGDGIGIWGNRQGLLSFAEFVISVATMPYDKNELSHEHFGFSHSLEIKDGKILMRIGRKPLIPPGKTRPGSGQDLTIGLSRSPKKFFRKD